MEDLGAEDVLDVPHVLRAEGQTPFSKALGGARKEKFDEVRLPVD